MHLLRNRIQEAMGFMELGNRERALEALKKLDSAIGAPRAMCDSDPVEFNVGAKVLTLEPMNGGVVLLAIADGPTMACAALPALDAFEIGDCMRWMADDMPVGYGMGMTFSGQLRTKAALQLVSGTRGKA